MEGISCRLVEIQLTKFQESQCSLGLQRGVDI